MFLGVPWFFWHQLQFVRRMTGSRQGGVIGGRRGGGHGKVAACWDFVNWRKEGYLRSEGQRGGVTAGVRRAV